MIRKSSFKVNKKTMPVSLVWAGIQTLLTECVLFQRKYPVITVSGYFFALNPLTTFA